MLGRPMGFAPPPDAPPPEQQGIVSADAGFEPSPTGASLCGFTLPGFQWSFAFNLPAFPPFDFPPDFSFFLGLNCDLSNPFTASVGFGGGRVGTFDPDQDPDATADL